MHTLLDAIRQDLRYAWRALRRSPGWSAVAIGCLAAGIGFNAAAFSVLDALLLRDLPGVERPARDPHRPNNPHPITWVFPKSISGAR